MKTVTLTRIEFMPDRTLGELSIDGEFFCHTLEDTDRGLKNTDSLIKIKSTKIFAETCIPYGEYECTYQLMVSHKVKHYYINGINGFNGVFLHSGNVPKHTLGCPLLGVLNGFVLQYSQKTVANFEKALDYKPFKLIIKHG